VANYTPDAPYVLGEEWVPIKPMPYTLSVSEERGHSFNLSAASTIVTGRFYTQDAPVVGIPQTIGGPSAIMAVYPKGTEDQTGPMKSVTIPCNGGSLSGDVAFEQAVTVDEALARVGDNRRIVSDPTAGSQSGSIFMNFAFSSYPELTGKRIVRIEFVYSMVQEGINSTQDICQLFQTDTDGVLLTSVAIVDTDTLLSKTGLNYNTIPSVNLPRYNSLWDLPSGYFTVGGSLFPWTYPGLVLFDDNTVTNQQSIELFFSFVDGSVASFDLEYAALRVTYCDEQRVAFGGTGGYIRPDSTSVELRAPSMAPGGVLLPAGAYTVTIEGDGPQTDVFALTELYGMRDQPGINIQRTDVIGSSFSASVSHQLPQLSLHTASATVPDVHGYGIQVQADVYTGRTAQQEIVSSANGTKDYPWARFYARRFGNTSQPLTLRHASFTSISSSISVTEFDLLPEIVDGWKEVTLRFDSPTPSFNGGGGLETYEWVSNEPSGSRWQILGESAYVKSGSFPLLQITGAQSLDATTYGGAAANLTWNGMNDTTSDGVLMFAQEMPMVSGLAVSTASLAVTGVGLDCGVPPQCIPTGISYNDITWTALGPSSMPASGFGYYELQRYDAVDDGWSTLLHANSPLVTGFHDYEARIGIESRYRIRFLHRLLFESDWSAEVANTLPGPGITGNQVGNSAIVFTTNENQSGDSSLAYTLVWESTPEETFDFIEAGDVQLQQMYLRDFQVAFRPLERGGERFQRTLLVQAAAVPSGLIRDGFKSLRDLAWDDVSYICVRNELGDRWYATVLVPSGNVMRNRRLYLAQVDIIEVTDTSSIVMLPEGSGTDGDGGTGGACFAPALWDQNPGWDYGCWT
jgi:hypothetical protein